MALPTLEKTWQFSVNQSVGGIAVDNDNADLLWKIQNALKNFVSGQWSVASSSDGSNFGLSDFWQTDYTDITWAAGSVAHSWIVLTNSATNAQLCIDCNVAEAGSETGQVYFSPGGGYATTGLATTDRPTPPADEVLITAGPGYGGSDGAWNGKVHVMMSSDGEATRIAVCESNGCVALWLLDAARNPITGWTNANIGCAAGRSSSGVSDYSTYANLNAATKLKSYITTSFDLYLTSEGYGSGMVGNSPSGTVADSQTGSWPMLPIGLASETAAHVGRKGGLYDIWWGSVTRNTGDSYPNDTSYQFVQFGDIILPWSGVLPQVS
jgi:hypothetical protein